MANQQERLVATAYFAGVLDSEGWVGIAKQDRKGHGYVDGYQLKPSISIHMVGPDTVDYLDRLAKIIGIPSYVQHQSGGTSRWSIVGLSRVPRALEPLLPYLFVKKQQAELVLEFCSSRFNSPERGKGYTEREKEIRLLLGELNYKGKGKNPQRLYAGQPRTVRTPTPKRHHPFRTPDSIRHRICEESKGGKSELEIARLLDGEGIPTMFGGNWHPGVVRKILREELMR